MKKFRIDLAPYPTPESGVEAAKQFLIEHGFTIIQHNDRWFDFMLDNRFGHFTVATHFGYGVSSSYKPGHAGGTGCQYVTDAFEFNLDDFKTALNYLLPSVRRDDIKFYRDLDDRIAHHWDKENVTVHYPPTPQSNSDRLGFDNGSQ